MGDRPAVPEYVWDVFLSYRRWQQWPKWIQTVLLPILSHWLGEELGREPRIFVDDPEIRPGKDWVRELAEQHSRSAILVPLMSKLYFQSDWCKAELKLMEEREQVCGYRTKERGDVLIVPAIVHDCSPPPEGVSRFQPMILRQHVRTSTPERSPTALGLEGLVIEWVSSLTQAIDAAPDCDPEWYDRAYEVMGETHEDAPPRQLTNPTL